MQITELVADFNEVFDEDYIWVSVRRTQTLEAQALQPGDIVSLRDEDGLRCLATVTDRNGPIVTCLLDKTSWRSVILHAPMCYQGERVDWRDTSPVSVDPESKLELLRVNG